MIIFRNEKALDQLLKKGVVYTFRSHTHKLSRDWVTNKRGNKKVCDVKVTEVVRVKLSKKDLEPYSYKSGFESIDDWMSAIKEFNGNIEYGYIWKVELILYNLNYVS